MRRTVVVSLVAAVLLGVAVGLAGYIGSFQCRTEEFRTLDRDFRRQLAA